MSKITTLDQEKRICYETFQYLVKGIPSQASASKGKELQNKNDSVSLAKQGVDSQEQRQHDYLIRVALALLLDATSPGPDPLAVRALGWGYGGSIGNFNTCHYMPKEIQQFLMDLGNNVTDEILTEEPSTDNFEASLHTNSLLLPTKFCTIGDLPQYTLPYTRNGLLWSPPIAGICVPGSCTGRSLFALFGENDLIESLLRMALNEDAKDRTAMSKGKAILDGLLPHGEPRRYKYFSYLTQSLAAGRDIQMGLVCETETGLPELDYHYRSNGYYLTILLLYALLGSVVIGTILVATSCKRKTSASNVKGFGADNDDGGNSFLDTSIHENGETQLHSSAIATLTNKTNVKFYGTTTSHRGMKSLDMDDTNKGNREYDIFSLHSSMVSTRSYSSDKKEAFDNTTLSWNSIMQKLATFFICFDVGASIDQILRIEKLDESDCQIMIKSYNSEERASDLTSLLPSTTNESKDTSNRVETAQVSVSISSSKCLDGMRSISMLLVILGHTVAVSSSLGYENPAACLPPTGMMSGSILAMTILSARYAVDTFFFLSGYLTMSGLLVRQDQLLTLQSVSDSRKSIQEWLVYFSNIGIVNRNHVVKGRYANRFSIRTDLESKFFGDTNSFPNFLSVISRRLTRILPTYSFVLLLWWKVGVTLGEGPYWPRWATLVAQCDFHAWTNMLFVNNIVPRYQPLGETSECMYHAWYLAVDFQLCTLLSPLIVALYLRKGWRKITLALEFVAIIVVIIASFRCAQLYSWSGHLMDGVKTLSFDRDFYISTFFRSTPYLSGFIAAQIWHEKCRLCPSVGLTSHVSYFLSSLGAVIILVVAYVGRSAYQKRPCLVWESPDSSDCGSGWTNPYLAIYASVIRPLWSAGLLLVSFMCFNGQFHFLGSSAIINWRGWEPVAKLSFSMYLVHPLVINIWFFGSESKVYYSNLSLLYSYAAVLGITLVSSLALGILVESPSIRLSSYIGSARKNASFSI